MGTSKPSLSKRKIKLIQPNPAIKHLVFQRLRLFYANSAVQTITLMPIAVLEPQSSRTIKTVLLSVRRPKATGDRDWIPNFKELKVLMSKTG